MRRRPADPEYLELQQILRERGYFRPAPWGYLLKSGVLLVIFGACYGLLLVPRPLWQVLGLLVVFAQMTAQLAYISHDAGHGAVTKNRRLSRLIGHLGMTVVTGFSFSWWMHSHDNHHAELNEVEDDLAMKYSLVLAVHPAAARARRGAGRWLLRWQAWTVWLLIPLYHFAMMIDGLVWMVRHPRETRGDQLGFVLYLVLYFGIPPWFIGWKWAFVHWAIASMVGSVYIALTFIVHHVGKRVWGPEEQPTLLQQQLESTRTLRTWRIFDFYYSGLNYHIEHHLFHWVPHWRYRAMRLEVQRFCRERGIAGYREEGFWEAMGNVFRHLDALGRLADEPLERATPEVG